jgi:hypothetical protein
VLPLLFGRHFVVGGRVGPFLFFGFLLGLLDGVGLSRLGGGDEGVDGENDEAGVDCSVGGQNADLLSERVRRLTS